MNYIGKKIFVPARWLLFAAALLSGITPAFARTITLTEADADKMAVITAEAPRLGWAGADEGGGVYSNLPIQIAPLHSFLIHFPLDAIPKNCRIIKAEWSVPIDYSWGNGTRIFIWRLLVDWGAGVCHLYRTTKPQPVEWSVAGAGGNSTDRAASPTVIATPKPVSDVLKLNVTQDVEFWHTRVGVNNGWMLTVEDEGGVIRLGSPLSNQRTWRLQITYEPQ